MKDKIKKIINTKEFNMCMVALIIFVILFISGIVSLKYSVEGEANPPFSLNKISIVSTVGGTDKEDLENIWNIEVDQNNDIYLYIKKNNNYKETETIQSIKIDNFIVKEQPKVGNVVLLKPDSNDEKVIFKNTSENEVNNIEYLGDLETSIKDLKISNQGGIIVFRCKNGNISNYVSNNQGEQINQSDLLNILSINNEDLKFKISFDIYINLSSGKSYKSKIDLEFPINDVVKDGTQSIEYTDNFVFKRI